MEPGDARLLSSRRGCHSRSVAAKLTRRYNELVEQLQLAFPPRLVETPFTPKANNKRYGYVKGVEMIKRHTVVFDPASRQEIARRFVALGWKPLAYGKDGHAETREECFS